MAIRAQATKVAGTAIARSVALPLIEDEQDVSSLVDDMRTDYQAVFAVETLQSLAARIDVRVGVVTGDEAASDLAESLTELWRRTARQLIGKSFEYGRAAFEKVWRNDPETGLTLVRKLEYLPPSVRGSKFTEMVLDETGRFDGVKLKGQGSDAWTLPVQDAYWHGVDTTIIEPHGRSRYLGAPQSVRRKRKELDRLMDIFIKKHVLKGGIAHVEPTVYDARTGNPIDNFQIVAAHLDALQSGGWLIQPSTRDANGNLLNDFRLEASTTDPAGLLDLQRYLDAQMSRSLLVHESLLTEGDTGMGSGNAVVSFVGMLLASVEDLVEQAVQSFQKYVVEKAVARNAIAAKLQTTYVPLSNSDNSQMNQIAASVLTNNTLSPVIQSGAVDLIQILKAAGFPMTEDAAKKLQDSIDDAKQVAQEMREMKQNAGPAEGGASGFKQAAPRPEEQGGNGGDPNKSDTPKG
jgi:hypothetical protein